MPCSISVASYFSHEGIVKVLLEAGVDVESKDWHSRTPLWYAAQNGHEAVVKLQQSRASSNS
jgi:ankyrin repeat protein